MSKPMALAIFLVGILVGIPIIIAMVILGAGHVFSTTGGALYYGFILLLIAVDTFTIPAMWGIMANN